jgi:hypothetical protein
MCGCHISVYILYMVHADDNPVLWEYVSVCYICMEESSLPMEVVQQEQYWHHWPMMRMSHLNSSGEYVVYYAPSQDLFCSLDVEKEGTQNEENGNSQCSRAYKETNSPVAKKRMYKTIPIQWKEGRYT